MKFVVSKFKLQTMKCNNKILNNVFLYFYELYGKKMAEHLVMQTI
jgi:hypothetical protein